MADDLAATPGQTVGPFFHNVLASVGDREMVPTDAPGSVRLHGHVYDGVGSPVPDALVEIRQADPDGVVPRATGSLRRAGGTFTGWGRAGTDPSGRYWFSTLEPGSARAQSAPFFAVIVFARGLLHRLCTRAYLPAHGQALDRDPLLRALAPERRGTLLARREGDGSLRFDVHLQGSQETVFLRFPGAS